MKMKVFSLKPRGRNPSKAGAKYIPHFEGGKDGCRLLTDFWLIFKSGLSVRTSVKCRYLTEF